MLHEILPLEYLVKLSDKQQKHKNKDEWGEDDEWGVE